MGAVSYIDAAGQQSNSADPHAGSQPADNPVEIKVVVWWETLADTLAAVLQIGGG